MLCRRLFFSVSVSVSSLPFRRELHGQSHHIAVNTTMPVLAAALHFLQGSKQLYVFDTCKLTQGGLMLSACVVLQ
ncbi:hypothetical protein DER45DRAFT_165882 [Fusarium avenaceum]|nr:hypothetical protein DER45DRAFT_165882 [Fusarium avenaceum]